MKSSFAQNQFFYIQKSNIAAQTIDGSRLKTYGMIIALFLIDKER